MASHLETLDRELVSLALGRTKRLVVQMPPRHGKSELCSKHFPAWYLGWYPHKNVILTSATDDLAMDFSAASRDILKEHGQSLWGVKMREDRGSTQRWQTAQGGGLRAAGVGGGIMGRGADLLIIDDYFKNVEVALSETQRTKLYQWYLSTSGTRLSPTGAVLIIATRWHKDDLIGQVLKEAEETGEEWRVVNFPAINSDGAALWPGQWPIEAMQAKRNQYYASGYPWMWEALYQQEPPSTLDAEWPEEYFDDIWVDELPAERHLRATALDPSLGKTESADYSAFVSVDKGHDGVFYAQADIARRPVPVIVEDGIRFLADVRPDAFGCETVQFQEMLRYTFEQQLHRTGLNMHGVYGIHNNIAKLSRIRSLGHLLAAGKLKLVRGRPGTALLFEMLRNFPAHKYDDGPDALEMAIRLCEELLQGTGYETPQYEVLTA